MKFPFPVFIALLLACVVPACKKSVPIAAPPPNAAGQWHWSNDLLGTWQLDLNEDGTFQRVITNPLDPKPVFHSGRWVIVVNPPRGGLMPKNDVDDEMLRAAGVDGNDKSMQWSAPGVIMFSYTVPKGTQLVSGAQWNGVAHSQTDDPASPVDVEIEERHPVRTHTDTIIQKTYLDLEGRVFKARSGKIATEGPASTPAPAETDFLAVTPFPGIRLDVPAAWQAADADAAQAPFIPITTFAHPSQATKPGGAWRFSPTGETKDAYIVVAVQPSILSPQQLADTSAINLERFAAGFVKGATRALDGQGFLLSPAVKAERTMVGTHAAVLCTTSMTDPEGNHRAVRAYAVPTEATTIVIVYCWDTLPGKPWKAIMDRAWTSLRIAEK